MTRATPTPSPARALPLVLAMLLASCATALGSGNEAREPAPVRYSDRQGPLRIALIGMVHGHVEGLLWAARDRDDIELVGVYEPDDALFERLAEKYGLDPMTRYDDVGAMLDATRPEAASVMTSIADHLWAVEACAPRGVHVLVEKPLAFRADEAHRMRELGERHGVLVLTNFETSWYASVREVGSMADLGELGAIRRMVFRHGHPGPIEIGCAPEFTDWLCDPAENGAGALVDFGCYGALLATWLMDGRRPTAVRALTNQTKPGLYPLVDDDATIVLTYPGATAVIQASWAWTHDNKDMDVHAERGSAHAGKWDELTVRRPDAEPVAVRPAILADQYRDEWTYLRHVVRGECPVDPLSGPALNVIVAEILEAAIADAGGPAGG